MPQIFFCFRRQIIDALAAPFRDKQRLHDGAFIAALLVSTDDAASSSTTMTEADLIADAADLMRRIPMTRITLQMLAASPRDANYDSAASFREGDPRVATLVRAITSFLTAGATTRRTSMHN